MTTNKESLFQVLEELSASVQPTKRPVAPNADVMAVASGSVDAGGEKKFARKPLTPEQRERELERYRRQRANMTPEQRERERARKRIENMTPEQRERERARKRELWANMTPEQLEQTLQRRQKLWANMTLEQLERKLEQQRNINRARWANLTPEQLELHRKHLRERNESRSPDPTLFAINQAKRYATLGKSTRNITPNCPEPARSQLQALVDRIKTDPNAGKPVIKLLMKMRDIRKLELAELQMQAEQQGDQPESFQQTMK